MDAEYLIDHSQGGIFANGTVLWAWEHSGMPYTPGAVIRPITVFAIVTKQRDPFGPIDSYGHSIEIFLRHPDDGMHVPYIVC